MNTTYTFDRANVLTVTAKAIGTESQAILTRSIGLAQLVLNGDVSDTEKLQLVGLKDFPKQDDKIGRERLKYANKMVREMAVVKLVSDEIKAELMALNPADAKALRKWQGEKVLDGAVILTGAAFLRYLSDRITSENKAQMTTTAPASTKRAKTKTATATAPTGAATVEAIQAQPDEKADQAVAALAEMMLANDIIGKALASTHGIDPNVALVNMANAWRKDREALLAEIQAQKVRIANLTAPASQQVAA